MENLGVVSVIVPIYNVEKDLHRCIDSLQNQTYPYLEIILVDDGSPDKCGEICDTYAARDSRMKVIHKQNAGLGMARNSGLDAATGAFVLFVDSDDYVSSTHVENLIRVMVDEQTDLVVGGYVRNFLDGDKRICKTTDSLQVLKDNQIIPAGLMPILGADPSASGDVDRQMSVWINLYRKDLIDALNLRFVSERDYVSEDLFFNILYILNAKVMALIPDCGYVYSENLNSLTHSYRPDRFVKYCKMLRYETEILKQYGIFEMAEQRVYRTFIMKIKKCIALIACSNMKWSQKCRECKCILQDPVFEKVLNSYAGHVSGKKQKLQLYMLRKKMIIPLLAFYRIKYR